MNDFSGCICVRCGFCDVDEDACCVTCGRDAVIFENGEPIHATLADHIDGLESEIGKRDATIDSIRARLVQTEETIGAIEEMTKDCPVGWHDGKIVTARGTTPGDIIAWISAFRAVFEHLPGRDPKAEINADVAGVPVPVGLERTELHRIMDRATLFVAPPLELPPEFERGYSAGIERAIKLLQEFLAS